MTQTSSNPEFCIGRFFRLSGVFLIVMTYPLFSMIWRNNYPLLSTEVFLFFSAIILAAFLLGALAAVSRPGLSNVILALCISLVLILQFNLLFEQAAPLVLVLVLLVFVTRQKFSLLGLAVFAALISGAFVDSKLDQASKDKQLAQAGQDPTLPIVVHILLDEFIGPDGLPPQQAPQALRVSMQAFFERNGFDIYNQAYSHYHTTQDSLAHAFNFTNDGETLALEAAIFHKNLAVTQNRYFEQLHKHGYTINVYQSAMVEFCNAVPEAVGRCLTYNTPNLESMRENVPNVWLRFKVLALHLFRQSNLIYGFLKNRGWSQSWGVSHHQPMLIDEIGNDLERLRSGAYFAHLLIPHAPFIYRSDCQPDYTSEPWKREMSPGLAGNTPVTRAVRYLLYLAQAECALKEVERLFVRMRELDLYDDAFIVLHGDHGSRISLHSAHWLNKDQLTPEDYRDLFSTLYAVKFPGGEYREHLEMVSLNRLLSKTAMEITGQAPMEPGLEPVSDEAPFVYLSGQFPLLRQYINIFESQ